ncbi:hypothetical protein BJX61DRAFT_493750 [Aspergillus egyptiacus]|nr:hypothetical protein BJX61DRAFT_493750 [Aspergillus egyptiacus]
MSSASLAEITPHSTSNVVITEYPFHQPRQPTAKMPKFIALIKYDSQEAYQQHGSQIEQIATDAFTAKGATDQTLFISTRSMPPSHRTSFTVPDNVSADELKSIAFPEGVQCEIHPA